VRGRYYFDTGELSSSPNPNKHFKEIFVQNANQLQRDHSNTATQKAVEALGRKAIIYTADLSSQGDVKALTPTILKDGHKVNILVNCAGIQRRHPSAEFPDNDWNEVSNPPNFYQKTKLMGEERYFK
jgi:hypothetical protein